MFASVYLTTCTIPDVKKGTHDDAFMLAHLTVYYYVLDLFISHGGSPTVLGRHRGLGEERKKKKRTIHTHIDRELRIGYLRRRYILRT